MRNTMAEREMELYRLEGAQGAAAQAQANKQAGIAGAVQGLGSAAQYAGLSAALYKNKGQGIVGLTEEQKAALSSYGKLKETGLFDVTPY